MSRIAKVFVKSGYALEHGIYPWVVRRFSLAFAPQQRGVSMVEMMVGLAMGLLVILAISAVFLGSHKTDRSQEAVSRIQENARYAFEALGRAFRRAGYRADPVQTYLACGSNASGFPASTVGGFTFAACETLRGTASSFAIRYRGDADGFGRDCMGANVPAYTTTGVDLTTEVWDLSGGNLRCSVNGGPAQTIIENVGGINLTYGENTDGTNERQRNVDKYVAASGVSNWQDIVAVRVEFLLESSGNVSTRPQPYKFNGVTTTPSATDLKLRRVYSNTFFIRNIR